MKKILIGGAGLLVLAAGAMAAFLFLYPRPADTTDPRVFTGNAAALDYCMLPELNGDGPTANAIAKAYTPGCGWTRFPQPILGQCAEPLAPGVVDMRGLWQGPTPAGRLHVERIEQCGNRTVITSEGIIHDFRTDGTLKNGSHDIHPRYCVNSLAAVEFRGDVMAFRGFGTPFVVVTRHLEGDELVWDYPVVGVTRMTRICRLPPSAATRAAR